MNVCFKSHLKKMTNTLPDAMVRSFCFTQWNIEPKPETYWKDDLASYLCYQQEICPKTGQKHYQGYVQLCEGIRKRFTTLYKLNPCVKGTNENPSAGTWLKKARGSDIDNYEYCSKSESAVPETFFERGDRRAIDREKQKFDTSQARSRAVAGTLDPEASDEDAWFYAKHKREIEVLDKLRYDREIATRDFSEIKLYFLWGRPGTGKTYNAHYGKYEGKKVVDKYPDLSHCFDIKARFVGDGQPIFDGYTGQTRILIDEIDKKKDFPLDFILSATSERAGIYRCSHGTILGGWNEVFITSNTPPSQLWRIWDKPTRQFYDDPLFDCLKRRIIVVKMDVPISQEISLALAKTWNELENDNA